MVDSGKKLEVFRPCSCFIFIKVLFKSPILKSSKKISPNNFLLKQNFLLSPPKTPYSTKFTCLIFSCAVKEIYFLFCSYPFALFIPYCQSYPIKIDFYSINKKRILDISFHALSTEKISFLLC